MIVPRAVFEQLEADARSYYLWICLDYLSDTAYWLDMVVNLLTGFYDNGIIVREPRKLIRHYRFSRQLKWDLASIFPLDMLYIYTGRQIPWILLRLNRLLKLPRLSEFLYRAESRTQNPALFRTFCLFGELFIIVHLNGCVYYSFSSIVGIGSDRWVYPATAEWRTTVTNNTDFVNDTMLQKWTVCTYWSAMMLTSIIPQMNNPTNNEEIIFHCTEMFLGIILFTNILGRISALLSDLDKKHDHFKEKRDGVRSYIRMRKVGRDMEELVMRWFDYIWTTNQQLDEESVLTRLPEKIRLEIAKCIHFDILKKIHLFHDVPDQFLEQIGLKLKFEPFCPGSFVCRKGDIGREMYIIRRGRLQIVSDDGHTVLATLNPGAVFGELSILNIPGNKNENRRTTNVRALGYADLFSLSREDLWASLDDYPEAAVSMLGKATVILKNLDLYSEDLARETERRTRDYQQAVATLEARVDALVKNVEVFLHNCTVRSGRLEREVAQLEDAIQ
ncbi:cGMP-gated cation channel alpha-1-like [Paramacrobiotus metropolitanus]|uniref:cGMP-gated cation channel alpha-1-like n=1 Tax=Paramacrobiotus metropolitanus TaxID=2943436 RepID=UPI002445A030|nr:cGMP-gated cation channel alpha-1-like [Paramacrobiotus metropolitanus]